MKETKKKRGKYVICEDGDEVYSTNSIFWRNFFTTAKKDNGYCPNWVRQIVKKKVKRVKSFKEIVREMNV